MLRILGLVELMSTAQILELQSKIFGLNVTAVYLQFNESDLKAAYDAMPF